MEPHPITTIRSAAAWVGVAIAAFAVTLVLVLGDRANLLDEAWMLWVTKRVTSGDRLYSDVYYVSTPLGIWLSAAFALVGGVQLWVLRVLEVTIFVAELLLALSIARWCRVSAPTLILTSAAVFAVGAPASEWISVYSSVAVLFGMVALRVLLVWADRGDARAPTTPHPWVLAGVGAACGLSFASKPNIGLLVLVAACASIWITTRGGPAEARGPLGRALAAVGGAFVAVLVLMAIPIVAAGSWSAFVSDVFADKGDYLRVGTSYFTIVGNQFDVLVSAFGDGARALTLLHAVVVMLPIVIVAVAIWALVRARPASRARVALFVCFAAAALLSMFPRPGSNHLAGVWPLAFSATLGAAVLSTRDRPVSRLLHRFAFGAVACSVIAALVVITVHAGDARSDRLVARSGFAHLEGIPVPERFRAGVADIKRFVRDNTDGKVFIVREDAGFWYLTTGTRNPLPFDIPEISDFGADGERGVIRRLERGEANWVCVKPVKERANGDLEPRRIRHWVRAHFEFVATIRQCDMYRRPTELR